MNVNISSNHKEFSHEQKNAIRKKRTFRICNIAFWRINQQTNSGYWYFDTYDTCIFILSSCSWLVFTYQEKPNLDPSAPFLAENVENVFKIHEYIGNTAAITLPTTFVLTGRRTVSYFYRKSRKAILERFLKQEILVVELVSDFEKHTHLSETLEEKLKKFSAICMF